MRIRWITTDSLGGSFLTDSQLMKYATEQYKVQFTDKRKEKVDLIVVSNISGIEKEVMEDLTIPYVKIEHDYGFCRWYDALCDFHKCKECTVRGELYTTLYQNSLLNYFMSPRQYSVHAFHLGDIPNVRFVQSQVDVDALLTLNKAKEAGYTIAPVAIGKHKGIEAVITWAQVHKRLVHVFGRMEETILLEKMSKAKYVKYEGLLPNTKLLEQMARAEEIVFLPFWTEPTGRVAIEAIFLQCKVDTNSNLGLTSWLKEPTAVDLSLQMYVSRFVFWQSIFNVMGISGGGNNAAL